MVYVPIDAVQPERTNVLTVTEAISCLAHEHLIDEDDEDRCGYIAEPGTRIHDQLFVLKPHGSDKRCHTPSVRTFASAMQSADGAVLVRSDRRSKSFLRFPVPGVGRSQTSNTLCAGL